MRELKNVRSRPSSPPRAPSDSGNPSNPALPPNRPPYVMQDQRDDNAQLPPSGCRRCRAYNPSWAPLGDGSEQVLHRGERIDFKTFPCSGLIRRNWFALSRINSSGSVAQGSHLAELRWQLSQSPDFDRLRPGRVVAVAGVARGRRRNRSNREGARLAPNRKPRLQRTHSVKNSGSPTRRRRMAGFSD